MWPLGVLAALAGVYAYWTWMVLRAPYAPVGSDEYHYVLEAKSAYANGTWHSPFTLYERVARVGDFGFHGFMYNALHGAVARVLGYKAVWVVWVNVALLAAAVLLLYISRSMTLPQAALASAYLLMCFVVPVYTFTFMQENVQVFFAVLVWLVLQRMLVQRPGAHLWTGVFYAVITLATLFRPQWALWTVAAVPLARTRREGIVLSVIGLASPVVAYVMMHWFCAPYPLRNWFFQDALVIAQHEGLAGLIPAAWQRFSFNAWNYLVKYKIGFADFWIKYVYLAVLGLLVVVAWRARVRMAAAAALTGLTNLLVLWGAFDAIYWTDHRMLCASFVFMLITLAVYGAAWMRVIVCGALLVVLPDTMRVTRRHIAERQRIGRLTEQWHERVRACERIAEVITNHSMTTVLVSSKLYQHYDVIIPALPVRSAAGFPIRYTVNLFHHDDLARFGLLDVQYVMAAEPLTDGVYQLAYATPHFFLYRVTDQGTVRREETPNVVRNGAFADGLDHWSLMGSTSGIFVVRMRHGAEPQAWLRIENPRAEIVGVRQDVNVVSGAIYRLSATVRSCAGHMPVLFGGRVSLERRPRPAEQLIWMTEYNQWWNKSMLITSEMDGVAQVEVTMGYGQVASTGEFADVRFELVGRVGSATPATVPSAEDGL